MIKSFDRGNHRSPNTAGLLTSVSTSTTSSSSDSTILSWRRSLRLFQLAAVSRSSSGPCPRDVSLVAPSGLVQSGRALEHPCGSQSFDDARQVNERLSEWIKQITARLTNRPIIWHCSSCTPASDDAVVKTILLFFAGGWLRTRVSSAQTGSIYPFL